MITRYKTFVPNTDEAKQMIKELALSDQELRTVVNAVKQEMEPRFAAVKGNKADIQALFIRQSQHTMMTHLKALQEAKRAEVSQ